MRRQPMREEGRDSRLMEAVKSGELSYLAELFERYHRRIFGFCYRMTSSSALAEDLTQEVFVRILKYRESFRPGAEFGPWAFTMARNVCVDHFRRHSEEAVDPVDLEHRRSPEPSAFQVTSDRQDVSRLRTALEGLTPEQRELLVLTRFERRPYAEVAEALGCSVGAVKVRVHRTVRRLKELYGRLAEEAAS